MTPLREILSAIWKTIDAPHKWACLVMLVLAYKVAMKAAGTADGASLVALTRTTYEFMIWTFLVIGGYAKGKDLIEGATRALVALRGGASTTAAGAASATPPPAEPQPPAAPAL